MITATSHNNWADLIKTQDKDNLVTKLPFDLLRLVLSYLNLQDLPAVSLTCRGLNVAFHNDHLWRSFYNRRFKTLLPEGVDCLKAYQTRQLLNSNFSRGIFVTRVLKIHALRTVILAQGQLFTGSGNYKVQRWEELEKPNMTLDGPRGLSSDRIGPESQTFLLEKKGSLLSGVVTDDHDICIWDFESKKFTKTLKGHRGKILTPIIANGDLVSGSYDQTIKIWDLESGECKKTLIGHSGAISCLITAGKFVFSGSTDGTINIWNLETGKCLWTFHGHRGAITSLTLTDEILISGSSDNTIKIWDFATGACLKTLQGHTKPVCFLALADDYLISSTRQYRTSSDDDTILIWHIESGKCVKALKELIEDNDRPEVIHSLLLANGLLICGTTSDKVRMWNFSASDAVVLAEIADLIQKERDPVRTVPPYGELRRFACMPQKTRKKIYEELYELLKDAGAQDPEHAEGIFLEKDELHTYDSVKALAIENYLNPSQKKKSEMTDILFSFEPPVSAYDQTETLPFRIFKKVLNWMIKM